MKITFIFMFWISAVNARRSSGRSGSSSRSKSRLKDSLGILNTNSKVNPSLIGPSNDAKPISVSHPNCYMYISCRKKLPGHIFQQKKTKREKSKKTRKIESKDKPDIRSLTNNNSAVKKVSHRKKKNLRTQLIKQDSSKSLRTSNCNSPYKCNGFSENWFLQSYDINLKLSLVLIISIFI